MVTLGLPRRWGVCAMRTARPLSPASAVTPIAVGWAPAAAPRRRSGAAAIARVGGRWRVAAPRRLRLRTAAAQLAVLQDKGAPAEQVLAAAEAVPLAELMRRAAALRDAEQPGLVTFSPKVFLPLTRLCRDACSYCTFATPPAPGRRAFMTVSEAVAVARLGADHGCTEALFTLGDKPELLYPEAAAELAGMGHASTLDYVAAVAAAVMRETGLLPHINAGAAQRGAVGAWARLLCRAPRAPALVRAPRRCRRDGRAGPAPPQDRQRLPGKNGWKVLAVGLALSLRRAVVPTH